MDCPSVEVPVPAVGTVMKAMSLLWRWRVSRARDCIWLSVKDSSTATVRDAVLRKEYSAVGLLRVPLVRTLLTMERIQVCWRLTRSKSPLGREERSRV